MALTGTDEGYISVHSVTRPKARKQYRCDECNDLIVPGEKYRRDFMVWEGEANTAIVCAECDELIQKFFAAIPNPYRHELTFYTGDLHQAIIELRDEFGAYVDGFKYPEDPTP